MNIERRRILNMVSEGTINADEAERLIDALSRQDEIDAPRPNKKPGEAKYLRVLVDEADGETKNVRVKIPLQLIRAGMKMTSLLPTSARTKITAGLQEKGFKGDPFEFGAEDVETFIEALSELEITTDDDDGKKVRVFVE
jgi:hypothetical protein